MPPWIIWLPYVFFLVSNVQQQRYLLWMVRITHSRIMDPFLLFWALGMWNPKCPCGSLSLKFSGTLIVSSGGNILLEEPAPLGSQSLKLGGQEA